MKEIAKTGFQQIQGKAVTPGPRLALRSIRAHQFHEGQVCADLKSRGQIDKGEG